MGQPVELNGNGNLIVTSNRNPSNSRIVTDFTADNIDGIGLDVGATPHQTSERAVIKLGDFIFGQDPNKTGNKNALGTVDAAGTILTMPYALKSAIPFISVATGNIGNNGALTAITALSLIYTSGAFVYYPANSIAAATPAGWYWTVFSSTTAGTIFNNTYTNGVPAVPTTLVPFVTTGPGAFTGDTTEVFAHTFLLPAGALGANGQVRVTARFVSNNTVGVKTCRLRFSGQAGTIYMTRDVANSLGVWSQTNILNVGVTNIQKGDATVITGSGAAQLGAIATAVDTAVATSIVISLQKAAATDELIADSVLVEVFPS